MQDLPRQSEPPGHGPFDLRLAFLGAEAWPEEAADDALDLEAGWVFSSGSPRCRTEYGATTSSDRYNEAGVGVGRFHRSEHGGETLFRQDWAC